MLILTRKTNETLVITAGGDTIEVTILEIRGTQIRMGIKAPKDVHIIRKEIAGKYPPPDHPATKELTA